MFSELIHLLLLQKSVFVYWSASEPFTQIHTNRRVQNCVIKISTKYNKYKITPILMKLVILNYLVI